MASCFERLLSPCSCLLVRLILQPRTTTQTTNFSALQRTCMVLTVFARSVVSIVEERECGACSSKLLSRTESDRAKVRHIREQPDQILPRPPPSRPPFPVPTPFLHLGSLASRARQVRDRGKGANHQDRPARPCPGPGHGLGIGEGGGRRPRGRKTGRSCRSRATGNGRGEQLKYLLQVGLHI